MNSESTETAIWIGNQYLDLLNPDLSPDGLERLIFGTLAKLPRYNAIGTAKVWTVGQHLLLCVELLRQFHTDYSRSPDFTIRKEVTWGLLTHDAHEAFTGDRTSPFKRAAFRLLERGAPDPFGIIEDRVIQAIMQHWHLPHVGNPDKKIRDLIHFIDMQAASVEKYYLVSAASGSWPGLPGVPWDTDHQPPGRMGAFMRETLAMSPEKVEAELLRLFKFWKIPACNDPCTGRVPSCAANKGEK